MDRKRLLSAVTVLVAIVALVLVLANRSAPEVEAGGTTIITRTDRSSTTVEATSTTVAAAAVNPSRTTTTAPVATTTSSTPPPTTTVPQALPFQSTTNPVTADDLLASWRPGCPLGIEELRAVDVSFWGYDGSVRTGRLIVAADLADQMVAIMHDLYDARFPIERMEPVDVYGGDDDQSMAANNTSAFNCRPVTGGSAWSEHSYGRAIDVNPLVNPYVRGSTVLPPEGAAYADRSQDAAGMIHAGDVVVGAFAAQGWKWGGYWSSPTDYQHFSTTGH
ncbi:MAG: M15 family metallopeptidase [Acidimicrobiia bacterium]